MIVMFGFMFVKKFAEKIKGWCRDVGFPESFYSRVTLHGFRSGGCSDAINSGMSKDQVKVQGRWSGYAVDTYIHLCGTLVRRALEEVVNEAALTTSERLDAEQQRQYQMCKKWYDMWQESTN